MTAIPSIAAKPSPIKPENLGKWCYARRSMEVESQLLRALNGGTQGMRDQGVSLLPVDWREKIKPAVYASRLERSFLFPMYPDAVDAIAARPFQKAVKLKDAEGLQEELAKLEDDCDRQGTDLTSFARTMMRTEVDRGITMWLVDMPATPKSIPDGVGKDGKIVERKPTLADADTLDLRPYFVKVHPDNLIDWAWRKDAGGKDELAYIQVFDETNRTDPVSGDEKVIQRIRYWSTTEWQVWEREIPPYQGADGSNVNGPSLAVKARMAWSRSLNNTNTTGQDGYHFVSGAPHPLGEVPLVWANISQFGTDLLTARAPMIDLAWLNVAHWQSASQQTFILHFARAPILSLAGAPKEYEEGTKEPALGAGASLASASPDFKVEYVEPKGQAIEAGERDLKALEDKGATLGQQPLMMTTPGGPKTATGVSVDEVRTQAKAQAWVESLEWALYRSFVLAAKWLGVKLPEKFTVELFRDIGILARSQQDLDALDKMRARGDISLPTFLAAVIERGTLPRDLDIDAEVVAIEGEKTEKMDEFTQQAEVEAAASAKAKGPPVGAAA